MMKATEEARRNLVNVANGFRIGGQLLPEHLKKGLDLIQATLLILKHTDDDADEACYCAAKVLTLAQEMVWHFSYFLDEAYDSGFDFEVTDSGFSPASAQREFAD